MELYESINFICPNKNKINLIISAYRTFNGKSFVFSSVKLAKGKLVNGLHKYLPITGIPEYINFSKQLYFEDSNNFLGVQTLSGTGQLYLLAQLLKEIIKDEKTIYLPSPIWKNHFNVFHTSGFGLSTYNYTLEDKTWNFEYLYDNIKKIPVSNIILFHRCAHNPTGYDSLFHQLIDLMELCKKKNLLVLIDMTYLGFASGIILLDSGILRIIKNLDIPAFVCTSYAKTLDYIMNELETFLRGKICMKLPK